MSMWMYTNGKIERGHSHLKKLKEYVTGYIKEQISIC